MIDATHEWGIDRHAILNTVDGGSVWRAVTPPNTPPGTIFEDGFFMDANTGWVAYGAAQGVGGGGVLHTTDGGVTWSDSRLSVKRGAEFNVLGASLTFVDALHGWILVGRGAGMSHEAVDIHHTSDGGKTWRPLSGTGPLGSPTAPPAGSLPLAGDKSGIAFANRSDGWVTGEEPRTGYVYLYHTTDGGTTWTQQDLPNPAGHKLANLMLAVSPPKS